MSGFNLNKHLGGLKQGLKGFLFFVPSRLSNLVSWLKNDTGINAKAAAKFVGSSSQSLSIVSADFNPVNTSFSMGGWMNMTDTTAVRPINKWDGGAGASSFLIRTTGGGVLKFGLSANGTTLAEVGTTVLSGSTWTFVVGVYDSVNDLIKISVNGGAFETIAHTTGANDNVTPFRIGNDDSGAGDITGVMDGVFYTDEALSIGTVGNLYNGGSGLSYANASGEFTALVDYWEFNELSGNRTGELGHVLTDNNSVGSALGHIVEPISDGDAVYQWLDQSGQNNHAVQETFASQPIYDSAGFLTFDGVADNLNTDTWATPLASTTTGTWACWVKIVDATPSINNMLIFTGNGANVDRLNLYISSSTSKLVCQVMIGSVNQWILQTDAAAVSDNTWAHLAVVQDGVSPVLYVNGVAVAQTFTTSTDKTKWITDITNTYGRIGCFKISASDSQFLNGDIQQVEITSDALSQADITKLYNYNKPTA